MPGKASGLEVKLPDSQTFFSLLSLLLSQGPCFLVCPGRELHGPSPRSHLVDSVTPGLHAFSTERPAAWSSRGLGGAAAATPPISQAPDIGGDA